MANEVIINKFSFNDGFISPIQNSLIKILEKNGPLSRKDFVNTLKIPRTTIYDNLLKLQKRKLVEKFTRNNGKRGRPLVHWKLSD